MAQSVTLDAHIADLLCAHDVLQRVPNGPFELASIDVIPDAFVLGRFSAPYSARANQVAIRSGSPCSARPGEVSVLATLDLTTECSLDDLPHVIAKLVQHMQATAHCQTGGTDSYEAVSVCARPGAGPNVDVFVVIPAHASHGDEVALQSVRIAGCLVPFGCPSPSISVYKGPEGLSRSEAAQLQAWVGGSSSPLAWTEVYRASRDGFGAADFHARCDGKRRLLVLAKEMETDCLFGGFTEVGFTLLGGRNMYYDDPAAFVYSLDNPVGRCEKLASRGRGREVLAHAGFSACFGSDLRIASGADSCRSSWTQAGTVYQAPASSGGFFPMAGGQMVHWSAAEVLAWTVPL